MAFRRRDAAGPGGGAAEALARAVSVLRQYERGGVAVLPVTEVLALLGAGPEAVPQAPARDPLADPLTGCRPAAAPR